MLCLCWHPTALLTHEQRCAKDTDADAAGVPVQQCIVAVAMCVGGCTQDKDRILRWQVVSGTRHCPSHIVQHIAVDLRLKAALVWHKSPIEMCCNQAWHGAVLELKLEVTEAQVQLAKYSACTCRSVG